MKVLYDMEQIMFCSQHVKENSLIFADDSLRQVSNVLLKEVMDISLGNFTDEYVKYGISFTCKNTEIEYENTVVVTMTPALNQGS